MRFWGDGSPGTIPAQVVRRAIEQESSCGDGGVVDILMRQTENATAEGPI